MTNRPLTTPTPPSYLSSSTDRSTTHSLPLDSSTVETPPLSIPTTVGAHFLSSRVQTPPLCDQTRSHPNSGVTRETLRSRHTAPLPPVLGISFVDLFGGGTKSRLRGSFTLSTPRTLEGLPVSDPRDTPREQGNLWKSGRTRGGTPDSAVYREPSQDDFPGVAIPPRASLECLVRTSGGRIQKPWGLTTRLGGWEVGVPSETLGGRRSRSRVSSRE